ncbi:hypothetical protein [Aquamicrobium sp. LC103]|uniref:hypothetical protein n=1 Tax=Aquamicrobium sp. LC103 TaxID=1120658 RepID=UPI00063E8267|nr:hypothetical protein [Aquamicrobium sp. LC103]TKT75052.1 hypothetical protein XW59_021525 [Aquamicrobium sp. LC103]
MAKVAVACPICKGKAKHPKPASGHYLEIDCASCGHFQISDSVRQVVSKLSATVRRQSHERARLRAPYGSLPIITSYDLP